MSNDSLCLAYAMHLTTGTLHLLLHYTQSELFLSSQSLKCYVNCQELYNVMSMTFQMLFEQYKSKR